LASAYLHCGELKIPADPDNWKYATFELHTGDLTRANMVKNGIQSAGSGGLTIDAVKQKHISGVGKQSEMRIWKTGANMGEQNFIYDSLIQRKLN